MSTQMPSEWSVSVGDREADVTTDDPHEALEEAMRMADEDGDIMAEVPLALRPFAALLVVALILGAGVIVVVALASVWPVAACVMGWRVLAGRSWK